MRHFGKSSEHSFQNASAKGAAASSAYASSYAASCRGNILHSTDAGLLASVLFVLTVLIVLVRVLCVALALIPVSLVRIISAAYNRKPESQGTCFC